MDQEEFEVRGDLFTWVPLACMIAMVIGGLIILAGLLWLS